MKGHDWIEVNVVVEAELAEPVAEVFTTYLSQGVVIEPLEPWGEGTRDRVEAGPGSGPVRVYGYLPRDEELDAREIKIRKALYYLSKIKPLPEPDFLPLPDQDWTTAWRERYRPLPLGEKLIIVPSWLNNPESERIPLYLDPGMAFGSGTHPTTQLTLHLLGELLRDAEPDIMLDIGCGSGILCLAGVKLGVGTALGVDVDPDAVRIARQNAAQNQVEDRVEFREGSVAEVLQGAFRFRRAPLVTANIIAPVLLDLLGEGLTELVSPGGNLLLSGMLADQEEAVAEAVDELGLALETRQELGEWVAFRAVKPRG